MTLSKFFKAATLVAVGFTFGAAAEKLSAVAKKEEKSEEMTSEVVTEDFENEVTEDSVEE